MCHFNRLIGQLQAVSVSNTTSEQTPVRSRLKKHNKSATFHHFSKINFPNAFFLSADFLPNTQKRIILISITHNKPHTPERTKKWILARDRFIHTCCVVLNRVQTRNWN